jgi:hypothetical protein
LRKLFFVRPALVALILALPLCTQPRQPTLRVQTATGQTTFHIGERIPLKLTFTSPNDTQYSIFTRSFDRHGPGGFESFEVNPSSGWADPQATYWAYVGGPDPITAPLLPATPFLASEPLESSLDLNEWVRFDLPGLYTVRIKSTRVSSGREISSLQSNPIELQIIPATPGWQSATLDRGVEADLIYLATPAAIDKMTAQFREASHGYESRMGLLGLPDSMRSVAIASMRKRLDEPDYPITPMFFDTMLVLGLTPDSDIEGFRRQVQTANANLLRVIFDSAQKKGPAARAETMQTLRQFGLGN